MASNITSRSNKQIQQLLNKAGAHLVVDGIIGPKTAAAIKSFQKSHNLTVDGIVGAHTLSALTAKPAAKPAPAKAPAKTTVKVAPLKSADKVAKPTLSDLIGSDDAFQAQSQALGNIAAQYQAVANRQKGDLSQDLATAYKRLGYDPATNTWNTQDLNTTSGSALQNNNNDFAARGLIQSSYQNTATKNLGRQLNDKLSDTTTANTRQAQSITDQLAMNALGIQQQLQQAKSDAAARAAATLLANYGG